MSYEETLKHLELQVKEMIKDIVKASYALEDRNKRIKILEQENEDLKGQLRQFGIDLANKGEKKGLFLH